MIVGAANVSNALDESIEKPCVSCRRCHSERKCPQLQGYKCPELQGYKCPQLQGYKRRV